MKSITLDTNAYSDFRKGDLLITNEIRKSDLIFIPTIIIGELYSGFFHGNKLQDNERFLDLFLNNIFVRVVSIQSSTSKTYGRIHSELSKKGTMIPTNDIWIAACAIETNSTLVTYDKHFLMIPNLKLWKGIK